MSVSVTVSEKTNSESGTATVARALGGAQFITLAEACACRTGRGLMRHRRWIQSLMKPYASLARKGFMYVICPLCR